MIVHINLVFSPELLCIIQPNLLEAQVAVLNKEAINLINREFRDIDLSDAGIMHRLIIKMDSVCRRIGKEYNTNIKQMGFPYVKGVLTWISLDNLQMRLELRPEFPQPSTAKH